jgi:hypothetical protein
MDSEYAATQAGGSSMLGNKVADHILPSGANFAFVQALTQAKFWHQVLQQVAYRFAAFFAF